jgi:hypothetical protein
LLPCTIIMVNTMESKIEYEKIKIQIYVIRQYAYVTYMDVFWKTPLRSAPL